MNSKSYDFTAARTYQNGGGDWIYTFMPLVISLDTIALVDTRTQTQIEQGAVSTATITLSNGTDTVSKLIEVEGGKKRYSVGLELAVPEFAKWSVSFANVNSQYFYEYGNFEVIGGISGESISSREGYPLDSQITVNYDPAWAIDSQNDGYAYPANTDPTPFNGFEKDEFGYPKNWGVWKLDDNNDGYPWPTGYEDYIVRGLPVKIMSQDKTHWINASVGVFTDEKIINTYIKLIGDDEDANNGYAVNTE